jgi:hypothetical protein
VDFDCDAGLSSWAQGWSEQKKRVCCSREQKGCEFDCNAGYSNWLVGWSDGKKSFCCQTTGRGCSGEAPILREPRYDDGPATWAAAAGLLFGIVACGFCLVFLFFFFSRPNVQSALADVCPAVTDNVTKSLRQCANACNECARSCRAPQARKKELDGVEWIFKPADGRPIMTLAAPEFDAATTGNTLEPGEKFVVSSSQPPTIVEQPVVVDGGYQLEELDGGEGKCLFLNLADGRGWVLDREAGNEMCYKLFERVDELWLYDPKNDLPMAIRDSPFVEGNRTGEQLQPGEKFNVCEMQATEDSGSIIFLKLKDGRGWVFDQKDYYGDILCRRVLQELWEFRPANGAPIAIRFEPDVYAEKSSERVYPEETFEVEEVVPGDDGELFLKLADGRGWLFDKHPEQGTLCYRVY